MTDEKRLRELVFREIAKRSRENAGLSAVLNQLSFFKAMELVDGIVDALIAAQREEQQGGDGQ